MGVVVRQKVKGKGNPWWIFINYNGKRKAKLIGDKRAAEDTASAIREKLKKGEFRIEDNNGPLFKDYTQKWLEGYVKNSCKYSTWKSYEQIVKNHLEPIFGNKALNDISRTDIKDFIYRKLNQGLSGETVNNIKNALSGILTHAFEDGLISTNPASRTGKLIKRKDRAEDINPYTAEEVNLCLEACKEHYAQYYPFFLCGFRTGMRLGELQGLQLPDIDFAGRFMEVRRSYVRGRITTPKSGKIGRVPITPHLAETLKALKLKRKKETLKKGHPNMPEWVFCNEKGQILSRDNLRRVFYRCQEKAGLRRIRLHDMRHTYATIRIGKGDNIADVSHDLGHSFINITVDTYFHWMPNKQNISQVDELDNLGVKSNHPQPIRNLRN